MEKYKELYYQLFNAITDTLRELKQHNYGNAITILESAQIEAEESYISFDCNKDDFSQ